MRGNFSLGSLLEIMAENIPNPPGGALPPRPSEAAKVQPKKETVRINLPPKPTAAPTIKLPTLPSGAPPPPTGAGPVTSATVVLPTAGAPPRGPAVSTAGPATRTAGPATAQRPAPAGAPTMAAPRPQAAPALSGLDKGLAVAAAVISLASLGCVIYLAFFLYVPAGGS